MKFKFDKLKAAFRAKYERFKRFLEEDDNDGTILMGVFSVVASVFMCCIFVAFVCCMPFLVVILGISAIVQEIWNWISEVYNAKRNGKEKQ